MSKKNRKPWPKKAVVPQENALVGPLSAARMAANVANAQLSTGPRSEAGKAISSKNAVKSALTGRTVLLPTDDVEEYAAFLAEYEQSLKPVGQQEKELVQITVDCAWRLRRIQELEYALYVRGERQFGDAFADEPEQTRRSMILLETHLAYQKELRNLHIQEARIDRKRAKALAELQELQSARLEENEPSPEESMSDAEYFALLDAGYVPPHLAPYMSATKPVDRVDNGFDFSNDQAAISDDKLEDAKAA